MISLKILDIIDYYIKNKKIQKQRASICENYRRRNQNYDFTLLSVKTFDEALEKLESAK